MNIRIRQSDRLFSQFIRQRDKWRCTRCGKQYQPPTQALHCSHFYGRGRENTRFNPLNADAHCYGCHRYFTANPNEFREWKLKQLGQPQFDLLQIAANTYKKRDDYIDVLYVKELLKEI